MATAPKPEPLSAAGYLQHLHDLFAGTADVTLRLDEDEPFDPDEDAPWSVIQSIRLVEP